MKKITVLFFSFLLLVATAFALLLEQSYRQLVRNLYEVLTGHRIWFFRPKLDLLFPDFFAAFFFGLFVVLMVYLLRNKSYKKRTIAGMLSAIVFFFSLVGYCYLDGMMKLVQCTACADGTRGLRYSEIDYDRILLVSLILSALPALLAALNRKRTGAGKDNEA